MTETTEAPATVKPWLKWSWRYHHPHVEEFDSLDAAIVAAVWASDYGEESYACIETPEGGVIDKERMGELMDAYEDRRAAERAADPQPKPTYGIKVQMPGERDAAWWGSYLSQDERDAVAGRLRERFGDRVQLGRIPWPNGR